MNPQELYLFDLMGYLVVESVLTEQALVSLNEIFTQRQQAEADPNACKWRLGCREIGGSGSDLLEWGEPYLQLLNHPRLMPYLQTLLGDRLRLDHTYAEYMRQGAQGLYLHGGATPYDPAQYYLCQNGRMYNGLVAVVWALEDVPPGAGGFCCIPGSHKSQFFCPEAVRSLDPLSPWIQQVPVKAGSVILFTEALTHGALPWVANSERRSLFYKYSPGHLSWAKRYYANHAGLGLMGQQLLEPPYVQQRTAIKD